MEVGWGLSSLAADVQGILPPPFNSLSTLALDHSIQKSRLIDEESMHHQSVIVDSARDQRISIPSITVLFRFADLSTLSVVNGSTVHYCGRSCGDRRYSASRGMHSKIEGYSPSSGRIEVVARGSHRSPRIVGTCQDDAKTAGI